VGWLLSALLVAVGLVVLVGLVVRLVGRLRRNEATVTAVRAMLAAGLDRMRPSLEQLSDWRDSWRGRESAAPDA